MCSNTGKALEAGCGHHHAESHQSPIETSSISGLYKRPTVFGLCKVIEKFRTKYSCKSEYFHTMDVTNSLHPEETWPLNRPLKTDSHLPLPPCIPDSWWGKKSSLEMISWQRSEATTARQAPPSSLVVADNMLSNYPLNTADHSLTSSSHITWWRFFTRNNFKDSLTFFAPRLHWRPLRLIQLDRLVLRTPKHTSCANTRWYNFQDMVMHNVLY